MAISLDDKMKKLNAVDRRKIEARAAELIAEEMSLRDLRVAQSKTQVSLAKKLGIKQEGISRLEQRSDLLISTLRVYIEAMGGRLHLVAEFPDRPPVHVAGLAVMGNRARSRNPEKSKPARRS